MIRKRWTSKTKGLDEAPRNLGVYELAQAGNIVYIGSGEIRNRLHACNKKGMNFNQVRWKETNSTRRARQRERQALIKFQQRHNRLPKYNDKIPAAPD